MELHGMNGSDNFEMVISYQVYLNSSLSCEYHWRPINYKLCQHATHLCCPLREFSINILCDTCSLSFFNIFNLCLILKFNCKVTIHFIKNKQTVLMLLILCNLRMHPSDPLGNSSLIVFFLAFLLAQTISLACCFLSIPFHIISHWKVITRE